MIWLSLSLTASPQKTSVTVEIFGQDLQVDSKFMNGAAFITESYRRISVEEALERLASNFT